MDEDTLREMISAAERSEEAVKARRTVSVALAVGFRRVAALLQTAGVIIGGDRVGGESPFGFGDDAVVGLATAIGVAADLVRGAVQLLDADNVYAAAALVRQLVEAEYLAWAFGADQEEARRWLRSSADERRRMWQPRHLRDRAGDRFRGADYRYHCELGGHPTPAALELVATNGQSAAGRWWFDLAAHGSSIWDYAAIAIDASGYQGHVPDAQTSAEVSAAISGWREADPLIPVIGEVRRLNELDAASRRHVAGS